MSAAKSLLDRLLEDYPDTSRNRAKEWIVRGRVSVNGAVLRKPHHVLADPQDEVELLQPHAAGPDFGSGWTIHPRVTLLHLDSALAVVNKAAGLVSVPAPNCRISALSILADFLNGQLKSRDRRVTAKLLPPAWRRLEPMPVHRLDQYTSGVFCMALNPGAREHLIQQLTAHTMKREYIAFVEGRPSKPKGTWRNWLQLSKDEMRQRIISETEANRGHAEAVPAITHYEVVAGYTSHENIVTELRLRLETGRKHQIRVQAAGAGLPLIGDRTYNPNYGAGRKSAISFGRQALHAERLELEHPETGKRMSWRADWPSDLTELEKWLRRGSPRNPKSE